MLLTFFDGNVNLYLDKYLNDGGDRKVGFQKTFKALSDNTRREILNLLKDGAMTAGEIGSHFEMTGATISHHLSLLKEAGLISDDKRGKFIYYELNMSVLDEIMGWIVNLKSGESGGEGDEK